MEGAEHHEPLVVADALRDAATVTPQLIAEITGNACRRFPSVGHPARTAHITRLIDAQAWTDAALALIDLELPSWHIRRITYDSGEWYCALSRQRELPDWLDQSVETHHPELALAVLMALVEVQEVAASSVSTSVPASRCGLTLQSFSVSCDNVG